MSLRLLSLFTATGAAVMASLVAEEPLCQVEHEGSDGCIALGQGGEPAHISLLQTSLATGRVEAKHDQKHDEKHEKHGILEESKKMEKTQGHALPICEFAKGKPAFPPWDQLYDGKYRRESEQFYKVLQDVTDAGAKVILLYGTLLGAYRHHGVLPFDEDLDVYFDVCNNDDIIRSSGSSLAGMDCAAIKKVEEELGGYEFHKKVWEEVMMPSFTKKGLYRTKYLDTDEDYNVTHDSLPYGVRVSRDGTWGCDSCSEFIPGMDMTVVTGNFSNFQYTEYLDPMEYNDSQGVHAFNFSDSQLCECKFGPVKAYCSVHSKDILTQNYGEDFMVPKSQCDYYTQDFKPELDLNMRTEEECEWAKNLTSAKVAPESPSHSGSVQRSAAVAVLLAAAMLHFSQ